MKISRSTFAYVGMLAAGAVLAASAVLLPSAATFGQETDPESLATINANIEKLSQPSTAAAPAAPSNGAAATGSNDPVPPAAPIDASPSGDNLGAAQGVGATQLPSAGSGGYIGSESGIGYGLMALGVALMASGSLVWAYSRKQR